MCMHICMYIHVLWEGNMMSLGDVVIIIYRIVK